MKQKINFIFSLSTLREKKRLKEENKSKGKSVKALKVATLMWYQRFKFPVI